MVRAFYTAQLFCLSRASHPSTCSLNVVLKMVGLPSIEMSGTEFIDDCEELATLAPVVTAPIQHHVFVCTGKSCSAVDSAAVKAAFEIELKARGLQFGSEKKGRNPSGSVVLTECASVGFCAIGAAVLIYPDGIWYAQVRASDVREIV